MEDRIISNVGGDEGSILASECNTNTGDFNMTVSSKKPSLLRSQLLRRTTTRTKKRSPEATVANESHTTETADTITDAPVSIVVVEDISTVSQSSSNKEEGATLRRPEDESNLKTLGVQKVVSCDQSSSFKLHQVHHNTEVEIKNGTTIGKDDGDRSLDISIIESDEGDSGVELSLIEIEHDDESKSEGEGGSNQLTIKEEKILQSSIATAAAVATTNLSIVVTGNDIVVEYRDDNRSDRKDSSPQAVSSSCRQPPARRRPKGIIKRPRDSNITYHHPRRPLPPPLPPPGYREHSSPSSCATATSIDTNYAGHFPPLKKKVSFNEKQLVEQYKMSRLRRKEKYDKRRSFLGILSIAMPVIMPYLVAVLILVASSMIPLPTDQRQHQRQQSLSLEPALVNGRTNMPTLPSILVDVGSRMWDERTKEEEAATATRSITIENSDVTAVALVGTIGNNERSGASKILQAVVGVESASENAVAVAYRVENTNPVAKTVAVFFKILRTIFFPFHW